MKTNNQKTNWKYLLIVIILALIVSGGILYYQKKLFRQEIKFIELKTETLPKSKENFLEIPLKDLKTGQNKIGELIIEKIEPEVVCDLGNLKTLKTDSIKEDQEVAKIGNMLIKFLGWRSGYEGGDYEIICDIYNRAKVKIIGWYPGSEEFTVNVTSFSILDKNNQVIDKEEELPLPFTDAPKILFFSYGNHFYFLFTAGFYSGKAWALTENRLYVVDENDRVKRIYSWDYNKYQETNFLDYILGINNNLYLKVGDEIWELGENENIKNKFLANKIIIKNREISFQ